MLSASVKRFGATCVVSRKTYASKNSGRASSFSSIRAISVSSESASGLLIVPTSSALASGWSRVPVSSPPFRMMSGAWRNGAERRTDRGRGWHINQTA